MGSLLFIIELLLFVFVVEFVIEVVLFMLQNLVNCSLKYESKLAVASLGSCCKRMQDLRKCAFMVRVIGEGEGEREMEEDEDERDEDERDARLRVSQSEEGALVFAKREIILSRVEMTCWS